MSSRIELLTSYSVTQVLAVYTLEGPPSVLVISNGRFSQNSLWVANSLPAIYVHLMKQPHDLELLQPTVTFAIRSREQEHSILLGA